ncbi:hypothetical protein U27_04613 [Candidatus Vecturithrix granuli]|uniref:Uncharacterized protein n=1 Tax=Vecturithrix granuli TaxID=1499967 RepID=A0A081BZ91_VECG1|nr:hypothetical protein U27_04613 [Candidatus Vecturithrix granuli]
MLRLTLGDKILIGGLLLLSLASYPLLRTLMTEGSQVQIETDGRIFQVVSLDVDQTIAVPGPLGATFVVIHAGAVHVSASPCHNKICVNTGEISYAGQMIVCVPNKVVVRVIGKQELPYDAVTQ